MDELEKVEKLRQRADVSYEEAKEALDAAGGDLLDAMVYLEKQGKVKKPQQSVHSTSYEEQPQYASVKEKVAQQEREEQKSFGEKLKSLLNILWQKSRDNFFCVKHRDELVFKVPVWAFVLALLVGWHILVPVMIVALFFDCHYAFFGKDDLASANKAMEKASEMASEMADKVKDEFEKL
jgi:hypothetical protein